MGAGVIHTSSGNGPAAFDVSYQYLEITALGEDDAPTVDAGIADQSAVETGAFSFAVPADAFADDGGAENLTLTAELADGSDLPDWLTFDGTTFIGTPPDGAVGDLEIKVLANDGTNPSAETTFTLSIADDAAPGAISIGDAPEVLETGDTGVTTLLFPLTMVPPTAGDVTVEYIAGPVGLEGEVGSAVVTFDAAGLGTLSIDVPNDDVDDATDISVLLTAVTGTDVALGAPLVATGTVTEDDAIDPADIDGDGILNIDDPFAYDSSNGLDRVLTAGGEFTQSFDLATEDPFDADGGFSGILVNPLFTPPGTPSATDPYGDRTVEDKVTIANGALTITSSLEDSNQTNNTSTSNTIRDNYQSGVDVSGVDVFEVSTRVTSAGWLGVLGVNGYAQFGVQVGAGGLDDFVKLVVSDRGNGAAAVQLAHNQSLNIGEDNVDIPGVLFGALTATTAYEITLTVDRSVTENPANQAAAAGSVSGIVEFFDDQGQSLGTVETGTAYVLPGSAFAAAMQNQNSLTGDTGGIAYGVSITDGTGGDNQFTANFDFLTIRSLDEPLPNEAPTADPITLDPVDENAALVSIDLLVDANAADSDGGTLGVEGVTVKDADDNDVTFTLDGTSLSIDPAQFAALDTGDSATVTVSYNVTDGQGGVTPNTATLTVDGVDDAPIPMVSISGTPSAVEVDDDGVTTLLFDLAYTGGADETREITYTVDGGEEQSASVTFLNGVVTLSVNVDNDDLANGPDAVTVVLTGVGDNVTDAVDPAAATATGTVTEDDFAPVAIADTPSDGAGHAAHLRSGGQRHRRRSRWRRAHGHRDRRDRHGRITLSRSTMARSR